MGPMALGFAGLRWFSGGLAYFPRVSTGGSGRKRGASRARSEPKASGAAPAPPSRTNKRTGPRSPGTRPRRPVSESYASRSCAGAGSTAECAAPAEAPCVAGVPLDAPNT